MCSITSVLQNDRHFVIEFRCVIGVQLNNVLVKCLVELAQERHRVVEIINLVSTTSVSLLKRIVVSRTVCHGDVDVD